MKFRCLINAVVVAIVLFAAIGVRADDPITLDSLLDEMTDRAALARLPEPAYTCAQASSYDQHSVAEDEDGWFANNDRSYFVGPETINGREEWIMMDVEGPGVIVRWWVTSGQYLGTIRIYLDGSDEPAVEARVDELVGGEYLCGAPLSEESARGRNLFLPIPYAESCKVTFDRPNFQQSANGGDLLYYQINYRTYEEGTEVESFTMESLTATKEKTDVLQETLLKPGETIYSEDSHGTTIFHDDGTNLFSGTSYEIQESVGFGMRFPDKGGAISKLSLQLEAEDLVQALRSTIIRITFDNEQCVWCPIGEFFGSGVGVNPFKDWWREVNAEGVMTCYWVMPFKDKFEISFLNVDNSHSVKVIVKTIKLVPWDWDDRSMHFRTNWRQEREVETADGGGLALDWNYLIAQGQGVFVGDTLSVLNRHPAWWGEGDEKIYVDGETFPSHFGTGTEDYYGYAWCTPAFFESPFHAQPRAEGPRNYGHTTNSRVRLLDAIPFNESFRFDMEVWHWKATTIDYSVATHWYARPGATANHAPAPEEAAAPVMYDSPLFDALPGWKVDGRPSGSVEIQDLSQFRGGTWDNNDQLWWTGAKPGDRLTLLVETGFDGVNAYSVIVELTKAIDYGIVQFYLDGEKIGEPIDLYNDGVIPSGPIELGIARLDDKEHKLTVEIIGKNESAIPSYMFGLDRHEFDPID
jgi:hypothetical protein